ncbi:MAG: hypothetical protein KBD66_00400 [Candidatus Doudnabacteria bacterium]|nr:hypothetical protein [Candidatus Doudnabacteria bacterium]
MNKKVFYSLVFVTLALAIFFRFFHIGSLPGGLFPDEAANGLDINSMEQGQLQPFYERGNGREALFFYMIWGAVKLFGPSPFAHHATSALVGTLAVVFCFLATKQLFIAYKGREDGKIANQSIKLGRKTLFETIELGIGASNTIALLAAFLMATSAWHVVLSRTAFRANLIPLFVTATLYFLFAWKNSTQRKTQYFFAAFFGASFALGFYTYIAYRVLAPLLVIYLIWPFLASWKEHGLTATVRPYWKQTIIAIAVFAICITPLFHYFYTHPGSFVGRSGQVSVFNPELNHGDLIGTVVEVTRMSLLGYFAEGDLNWRHNISGQPFLSSLVSPFFLLGLLVVVWNACLYLFSPLKRKDKYPSFVLAGWFAAFLLPVITTAEGIPHGLRAIGTIPVVFIISAYGLYITASFVWHVVTAYQHGSPRMERMVQRSLQTLVFTFLIGLPLQTYANYFIFAANSPENFYAFRSDLTVVSEYLNEYGNRKTTYLVLDKFSVQTVDYLTTVDGARACDRTEAYRVSNCTDNPKNQPYTQVDPEDSWLSPHDQKQNKRIYEHGLEPGTQIVFTQSSIFDIKKFKAFHPNARLTVETRNKFGQAVLAVYTIQ